MKCEPIPDMRWVECPTCNGERGWEVHTGYDPRDGAQTGYWQDCHCSDGSVLEECPLITEKELMEGFVQ